MTAQQSKGVFLLMTLGFFFLILVSLIFENLFA